MDTISVIIRTRNEERWIKHCLTMVYRQDYPNFEVIIVDNMSTDGTLSIIKRFPVDKIIPLKEFKPGHAINTGIRSSKGSYIACLSAHCIPYAEDWLSCLYKSFTDKKIAGVYGRQIPVCFSEPSDKRDLLNLFGLDRRIQIKDYFFHNANSMFRQDVWEKSPFDEDASNIEDRIWGKTVISEGYNLVYEPEAVVYHYHGVHQNNDPDRIKGVVSIIEKVDEKSLNGLPDPMKPENCNVAMIIPILGNIVKIGCHDILAQLIENGEKSKYVQSIYLFSELSEIEKIAMEKGVSYIKRPPELVSKEKSIVDVLQYALQTIESSGNFPDIVLFTDYLYPFRPEGLFEDIINDLQYKGCDTVFPGYIDYHNYWVDSDSEGYVQINPNLKPREHKSPIYRALYGLGCASTASVIRSGRLIGETIGIIPIDDPQFTIKADDKKARHLLNIFFEKE